MSFQIWVDADACPKVIKDVLYRAANRMKIQMTLVANQMLTIPPSPFIKKAKVSAGFDVADNYIVQHSNAGDLVITADIPLADAVVAKGGFALNPRGFLYTTANIKQILAMRNLNEDLRSAGVIRSTSPAFSKKEVYEFSNSLDQFLTKYSRK